MSSFFSKFRPSKPSKKKGQPQTGPYGNGQYASSNSSSQASLATKPLSSAQSNRGFQTYATNAVGSATSLPQPSNASFRPQSTVSTNSHISQQSAPLFLRQPFNRAALVRGSFQTIVELPRYVDQNEWIALNLFEFNNCITQFVNVLSDYIDQNHVMSGGPGYDYLWIDTNKQPTRLPAATYIEYTLSWITGKLDDPSLFPTKQGVPFPPNFFGVVQSIYTQLFRIFAYLFNNHYDKIVHLSLEPHFNSLFCHFASYGKNFSLIDRNEVAPLVPVLQSFESQGKIA